MDTDQQHTPDLQHRTPWRVIPRPNRRTFDVVNRDGGLVFQTDYHSRAVRIVACVNACAGIPTAVLDQDAGLAHGNTIHTLETQRDELAAYAKCEDARSRGEDIAETVLKQHGFDPSKGTAVEFMDKMRRAALAKVPA